VNQVTPKDNFLVGCRQPGVGNCPEDAGPDHDFGSSPILRTGTEWQTDPARRAEVCRALRARSGRAGRFSGKFDSVAAARSAASSGDSLPTKETSTCRWPTRLVHSANPVSLLADFDWQATVACTGAGCELQLGTGALQQLTIGCGDLDSGCDLFRDSRRTLARLRHQRWNDHLGRRHGDYRLRLSTEV
jgi:polyvinyl alcohol dehydrogenase (cytochrome)